jgi:hypothetical protein
VDGVTGTVTWPGLPGGSTFIPTSLSPYAGSDNILYLPATLTSSNTTPAVVDFGGISFHTNGGIDFNLGGYSQSGPFILALQLPFLQVSESMGNHDSKIVDAGGVD